jgi:hypothetical protein
MENPANVGREPMAAFFQLSEMTLGQHKAVKTTLHRKYPERTIARTPP